jgi:uncharacterized membrane protein HdeD (DUF308 family)
MIKRSHIIVRALVFLFIGILLIWNYCNVVKLFVVAVGILSCIPEILHVYSILKIRILPVLSGWYILFPFMGIIIGGVILAVPFKAVALPFVLLGIGCVFNALSDILNYSVYRKND